MTLQNKPLPSTSYAILGLLSFGEALSGYEIRKQAQNMRFFYWAPAQSQVYSELKRLERHGFVKSQEVLQQDKPNKRLYLITNEGTQALQHWISDVRVDATIVKHSTALRLFFGHVSTPDVLIGILEDFMEDTKEMMGQLGIVQGFMESDPKFTYPELVIEWSYHYYESELAMAQKMVAKLHTQLDNTPINGKNTAQN